MLKHKSYSTSMLVDANGENGAVPAAIAGAKQFLRRQESNSPLEDTAQEQQSFCGLLLKFNITSSPIFFFFFSKWNHHHSYSVSSRRRNRCALLDPSA